MGSQPTTQPICNLVYEKILLSDSLQNCPEMVLLVAQYLLPRSQSLEACDIRS